ncbi:MAG: phage portal protein [Muribaculaceae bacterium]|nr:phage portal protein [Muribaculaceae bacterium]
MKLLDIFKRKEKRGLQYVSNYSDGLLFGQMVNNNGALALSAVYRAVEIISDNIAILPIKVKNIEKEHIADVESHNLLDIWQNRNGNYISKFNLIKMLVQSVLLHGNGYAFIQRDKDGNVEDIIYLENGDVTVNYNKHSKRLTYTITSLRKKVEPCNIIHLVKNSYNGIEGKSIISFANRSINNANQAENQSLNFYQSGCNLSGILTVQGQLNDTQKEQIRNSWNQAYNGNGQGLAVLQGNMNYQPISVNAHDAQLLEARQYNVNDIARFFGINPVLLGENNGVNLSSIEQIQQQFISYTLQPYITMLEEEFNRKLLKPSEFNYKIELDTTALIKTDKTATASYYSTLLDKGVLCINEVRKELGYNQIDGGDNHLIAYTDVAQNTINNTPTNEPQQQQ